MSRKRKKKARINKVNGASTTPAVAKYKSEQSDDGITQESSEPREVIDATVPEQGPDNSSLAETDIEKPSMNSGAQEKKSPSGGISVLQISTDTDLFRPGSSTRRRVVQQAKHVDEIHIIVLTTKSQKLKAAAVGENIFLHPTNSLFLSWSLLDGYLSANKLLKRVKQENLLVVSQNVFETGLLSYLVAKKSKVPLQVQVHTDFLSPTFVENHRYNRYRVAIAQYVLPRARSIRVVSQRIRESLMYYYGEAIEEKITVLPVQVDLDYIDRSPIRFDLHEEFPQYDFIMLTVSRLSPEKNLQLAIGVLDDLVLQHPKTGLIIAGEGPELPYLKRYVQYLGLDHNVKFIGHQIDVASLYKTTDVFLNTSEYEGYGRTLLEAAAAGCPIVTTDVGVVGDVLHDRMHALVCDVNDERCLIDHVLELMFNTDGRLAYGQEARQAAIATIVQRENHEVESFIDMWRRTLAR